ncbi:MAG TPA: hypothetical protein PK941_11115, partial [Paludibacter sp.]|nr:hypothetical protein [Paludibacter sp.]
MDEMVYRIKLEFEGQKDAAAIQSTLDAIQKEAQKKFEVKLEATQAQAALKNLQANSKDYIKAQTNLKTATLEVNKAVKAKMAEDTKAMQAQAQLTTISKQYKESTAELAKEIRNRNLVEKALADVEKQTSEIQKKVESGALSLTEAERKQTEITKALANQYITLKKQIEAQGKATEEQKKRLKDLEQALDSSREAADS